MTWLVSTSWLEDHRSDPDLVVLDCSWHLPDSGRNAHDDFVAGHIPGARFFDLNAISDPDTRYANMLPTAEHFARNAGGLGVGAETSVVVYDAGYVSARVWWMFRVFGHEHVRILDGGFRKWSAEGRAIETGAASSVALAAFPLRAPAGRVVTLAEMRERVERSDSVIVDARTAAKFDGRETSGYPGVPSGYMPGAINTPWASFFDAERNYAFVTPERAAQVFAEAGADVSGEVITTCGSGVTAAILGFMIERAGNKNWRLYDGSWHEWGQQPDTPKLKRVQEC